MELLVLHLDDLSRARVHCRAAEDPYILTSTIWWWIYCTEQRCHDIGSIDGPSRSLHQHPVGCDQAKSCVVGAPRNASELIGGTELHNEHGVIVYGDLLIELEYRGSLVCNVPDMTLGGALV